MDYSLTMIHFFNPKTKLLIKETAVAKNDRVWEERMHNEKVCAEHALRALLQSLTFVARFCATIIPPRLTSREVSGREKCAHVLVLQSLSWSGRVYICR